MIEEKLMNRGMQVSFSIHDHDRDGERIERGIYLHFGGTRLKVAENKGQLIALQKRLNTAISIGMVISTDEARLLLAELLLKAAAGFYNSYTEEDFIGRFNLQRNDRTLSKKGMRFICSMFYASSSTRPDAFELIKKYRVT